jgi:hypothetical protein
VAIARFHDEGATRAELLSAYRLGLRRALRAGLQRADAEDAALRAQVTVWRRMRR